MSFLYPRTIKITRPLGQTGVGWQSAYAGDTEGGETVLATGIPASIQAKGRQGKENPVKLPGDSTISMFTIFIPLNALARDVLQHHDVITDDLGQRYQVLTPGWDSLGYSAVCQSLEA